MIAREFQFNQGTGSVIETSQPVIKDEGFVNQIFMSLLHKPPISLTYFPQK